MKEVFQLNDMVEECRCHMAVECAMCIVNGGGGVCAGFLASWGRCILSNSAPGPCYFFLRVHFDGMLPLRDFFLAGVASRPL